MIIIQIHLEVYGSLNEQNMNNGNPVDVTTADSTSFEHKSNILGNPAADGALRNVKMVVLLKYY